MTFMFFFISFAPPKRRRVRVAPLPTVGTAQTAVAITAPLEHPVRALVRITSIGNIAFDTYHPGSPDQEQHRILLDAVITERTTWFQRTAVNDEDIYWH